MVKLRYVLLSATLAGAGALLYGALVEVNRLRLETRTLRLPRWPRRLAGYRIALLADLHLRDRQSVELCERALSIALDASPDMVVLAGDYVSRWKPESPKMLGDLLEPLLLMQGRVVAVPGNRDYLSGDASLLEGIFGALNIRLLRNDVWHHDGINWVGIDSANACQADPLGAMMKVSNADPCIAVWHEPDMVEWLPEGPALMLSGHSHGGQFTTPWGWAPMTSKNGRRFLRGYYPDAPTPVYVSRGLGTTGPPSRLFCPPEVTILTLVPA